MESQSAKFSQEGPSSGTPAGFMFKKLYTLKKNHLYVECKKIIQMNLLTKQNRFTDMENLWLPKGKGAGGGIN